MKKTLKVIIPSIMLVAGIVLCLVAVSLGAKGGMFGGIRNGSDFTGEVTSDITRLEIDMFYGDIIIKSTEEDTIYYEAVNLNEDWFSVSYDDDEASISHRRAKYNIYPFFNISLFNFGREETSSKLIIYIPQKLFLKELSIEGGVGEVRFDNVVVGDVSIENGIMDAKIFDLTAENVEIDCGIGNLRFEGLSAKTLSVDNGIGEIKISGEIEREIEIDNGIGDICLELYGEYSSHYVDGDTGIGSVKTLHEAEFEQGKRTYKIMVDNGIGDIIVKFF